MRHQLARYDHHPSCCRKHGSRDWCRAREGWITSNALSPTPLPFHEGSNSAPNTHAIFDDLTDDDDGRDDEVTREDPASPIFGDNTARADEASSKLRSELPNGGMPSLGMGVALHPPMVTPPPPPRCFPLSAPPPRSLARSRW